MKSKYLLYIHTLYIFKTKIILIFLKRRYNKKINKEHNNFILIKKYFTGR